MFKSVIAVAIACTFAMVPVSEALAKKNSFGGGGSKSSSYSSPSASKSMTIGSGNRGYSDSAVMAKARQSPTAPAPSVVPSSPRSPQPTMVPAPNVAKAPMAPAYSAPIYQGRNAQPYPGTAPKPYSGSSSKGYSGTAIAGAVVAGAVAGAVVNEALDDDGVTQQVAPSQPAVVSSMSGDNSKSSSGWGTTLVVLAAIGGALFIGYRVLSNANTVKPSKNTLMGGVGPSGSGTSMSNTSYGMQSSMDTVIQSNVSAEQVKLVTQLERNAETLFRSIKNAHANADIYRLSEQLSSSLQNAMGNELTDLEPSKEFTIRRLQAPKMIDARVNSAGDLVAAIQYTWTESDSEGHADNDAVWFFIYNDITKQWQLHGWEDK